jgi:uncharacterized protein (DUF2141 family)
MSLARNIRWKLRLKAFAALLCLCFPALPMHAESSGGEARLVSARVVEVTPGKIVTASILIANRSDADAVYEETFALPANWQRISPPAAPISLSPGAQQLRLIAFAVPATSPAGSFDLGYVLGNSRNQSPVATATVTVVVLPVAKLELIREDQTDTVIAGEMYEARLRIINRGNSRLQISIDAASAPVTAVRLDPATFWLEAASSQAVRAFIKTDVELQKPITQVINFKVTAAGPNGAAVAASQSVAVNLIPRISGDRDPYVRLPAQLRLMAVAEDGRAGGQAEFSGSGYLDENRTQQLEFLFRGPSLDNKSIYGLRNEYRVSYSGPKLDVQLGDQNYSLSPLTQRFSYGRGVAVVFHPGPTSAGAFFMETLARTRNFQTAGAYVRREFTPAFSLQANALYKSETGLAQPSGALGLVSLQPHFNFGKSLDLDLEYAASTGGSGTSAQAHRVQAQGQLFDDVTYSIERVQAGSSFFGYYHGTETAQAAVTFPLYGPLRGKASFNQDARDAYADTFIDRPLPAAAVPAVSRQTAYRPGLQLRVSTRTDLSLEYQNIERHGSLLTGPQNSLEQSARVGIGHNQGGFSVQTFAEFGATDKSGPGAMAGREAVERYSTFLSYRPTPRQSYSIFGTRGSSTTLDQIARSQTLGASAQWNLTKRLSAGLNYARNAYDSRTARVQDTATGTVSYTMANRNVVALQARWVKDSGTRQSGTSMTVNYTIPFGLPVSKKKNRGVLRGRVFEVEGDTSRPMSRVIVTANGITAVTDRKGEFVFPSLRPGLYQVNIEQSSLGVDRVTLESVPLTVEVGKGGTVELAIGVVRSARVRAKVTIFGSAGRTLTPGGRGTSGNTFEPLGGLAAGLVELTNGKQVLRQVTDRDGEASFDNLRPGKWTLRVYENNVPEYHAIETPETEIEVEPGQSREALVRILPKRRPVRFIDEGKIAPITKR